MLNNIYKQIPTTRLTHIRVLQPLANQFQEKEVFNAFYITEVILRAADYQTSKMMQPTVINHLFTI